MSKTDTEITRWNHAGRSCDWLLLKARRKAGGYVSYELSRYGDERLDWIVAGPANSRLPSSSK